MSQQSSSTRKTFFERSSYFSSFFTDSTYRIVTIVTRHELSSIFTSNIISTLYNSAFCGFGFTARFIFFMAFNFRRKNREISFRSDIIFRTFSVYSNPEFIYIS